MPSGIGALAFGWQTHYKPNSRDDIAFYETAKEIRDSFYWETASNNPATPKDDFLAKIRQQSEK
ncbi:MAG: hypothetical protein IPG39_16435 [Bacteroidetes bacterium]|nr:hypothetical protein [Bacteroidota bacterium]